MIRSDGGKLLLSPVALIARVRLRVAKRLHDVLGVSSELRKISSGRYVNEMKPRNMRVVGLILLGFLRKSCYRIIGLY